MNQWQEGITGGRRLWVGWLHGVGVEVYLEPSTRHPGLGLWAVGIGRLLFNPWTFVCRTPAVEENAIRDAFERVWIEIGRRQR